jgi:hypothetical protein
MRDARTHPRWDADWGEGFARNLDAGGFNAGPDEGIRVRKSIVGRDVVSVDNCLE